MNKMILLSACAMLTACGGGNNVAPMTSVGVGASTCVANCAGARAPMRPGVSVGMGVGIRR